MTVKDLKEMILKEEENTTIFFKDNRNNIYEISWILGADNKKEIGINNLTSFFNGNILDVEESYKSDNGVTLKDDLEAEIIEDVEYKYKK